MILYAVPKSWFSRNYDIMEKPRQVAELDMSWWREQGWLAIEGVSYKICRERLMSGAFILETAGTSVARAEKPNPLFRQFLIESEGRRLWLKAKSVFSREFALFEGSNQIGRVVPSGFLTRRAEAYLPDEFPLPVKIFILWLALILWNRESESASAGSGA